MREIADQVFAQSAEADSAQLRSKLAVLNDRLSSLLRICGQYKQILDGALRNRGASMSPSTPSGLNLSPTSPGSRSPHPSIVVLPSTEVSVSRKFGYHLWFLSFRILLSWHDLWFHFSLHTHDTFEFSISLRSQAVGHRLQEFPALRPWTNAHLPALPIPSTALLLLPFTQFHYLIHSQIVLHCSCSIWTVFSNSINQLFGLRNYSIAVATASALGSAQPEREESGGNAVAAAAVDTSVLQRGYRFFGRVIRTALPIQAVMLLVLGVASLVPTGNDSCMDANTVANSFELLLGYPDGPPPT